MRVAGCHSNEWLPPGDKLTVAGKPGKPVLTLMPLSKAPSPAVVDSAPHRRSMKAPLQERIFHPTYLRLLCLHIQGRGASPADALAGTGMTWRQVLHEKRLISLRAGTCACPVRAAFDRM